jgi:hypothetical protein
MSGAFACSVAAGKILGSFLMPYGELLPVQVVSGRGVLTFNCTNVVDCLDDQRTTWKIGERSRERLWVLKYVFDRARLPTAGQPFKLPQTAETDLLVADDPQDRPDSSLIAQVERAGLVGLRFDVLVELATRSTPR